MSNLKINISGVDFEKSNITFVNGLTMERVRLHYQWLLNAKVKDVIIGEDDYGIVWYFGDWYCGEWFDGTWYSGNFYNGTWDNGRWFSYKLHKFDVVNEKFIIEEISKEYSVFHNGLWRSGDWNNGIFGENAVEEWYNFVKFDYLNTNYNDIIVPNFKTFKEELEIYIQWKSDTNQFLTYINSGYTRGYFNIGEIILLENCELLDDYYEITEINYDTNDDIESFCFTVTEPDKINEIHKYEQNEYTYNDYKLFKLHDVDRFDTNLNSIYTEEIKNVATWLNGNWKDGLFQNAIWNNGIFENGLFLNSKWMNGRFYDGVFDGNTWYNGEWMNGDFIRGKWMNGVFTKLKADKISRFGASRNNILKTVCEWFSGEWKNGEWFSGYQIVDNYQLSLNNKLSIWYDGVWKNGTWYGGHFKSGSWIYGTWKNGIFGDIKDTDFIEASEVYENIDLDEFIYENQTVNNFGSFWSNDSGELVRDILNGDTPAVNNSTVKQDYIEVIHPTNIGGWYTGSTNLNKYYYDGATEESGKIILYIRDNFKQNEYNTKEQIYKKKFDLTYELSLPHVIEIGGSGFTASSATYINDENNQLYYYIGLYIPFTTLYSPFALPGSINQYFRVYGGYTKVVLNEYEIGLVNKINNFTDINIRTKEKIKYESGNGSGTTYLTFSDIIKNTSSKLEFRTNIQPSYIFYPQTGTCQTYDTWNEYDICICDEREIYVELDTNNTNYLNIVNGLHNITNVYFDTNDNLYHIVTNTQILNDIDISGKIINNFSYSNRLNNSKPQYILFQEFNQNLNITNHEEVVGVQVKYTMNFNKNSKKGELFDYNTILPFKNLFFKEFDFSGDPSYDTNTDYDNYDNYLNTYNYLINGKKIQNNLISNNDEIIVGVMNDLWELNDLIEYYPTTSGYNPDDYNIKKLLSVLNNIRISKSFQLYGTIDDDFNIEKIELKLFYVDNSIIWYNGVFEKGLWLNGSFVNGDMISSLIIMGDFHNGNLGFEPNDFRANR